MSSEINNLYEFANFRFEAEGKTLWHQEEMISLPPKALDVLSLLLEKEGKIVSKQEILNTVWANTFVEEGVLTQNIYKLRHALGTDENGKQFIENIPRRGYRLTVPVRILQNDKVPVWMDENPKTAISSKTSEIPDESVVVAGSSSVSTQDERSPRNSKSHLAILVGLGILLLAALVFVIYQFANRNNDKNESIIAPIERLRFQRLTDSGDVTFLTVSPNGELLAFIRHEPQGESVWIKQIATGSSVQIFPPVAKGYRTINFSPDSKYLYILEEANAGAIYQTPALSGGTLRKIADNVWSEFCVSPDGKQIAFIRRDLKRNVYLLMVSNIDGSGERELGVRTAPLSYSNVFSWSADGANIIVINEVPNILVVNASTGKETELKSSPKPQRWRAISGAEWMPDGKRLIISGREINEPVSQLWIMDYPSGETRRLTNDLEAYFSANLSADGRILVARQQKIISHIWVLPEGDLKKAKQLTSGERKLDGFGGLNWTPDGKIIFSHFAPAENITDLFQLNSDGTNRIQLTSNSGQDNGYPVISNDGRYIVFLSNRNGKQQIWRMDIDGRNPKQLTFDEEKGGGVDSPAITPDNKEVFYIKRGPNPSAIWKVSINGGNPTQVSRLTNAAAQNYVAISPDGKWMIYQHISDKAEAPSEERSIVIGVLPTDGNAEPKLFSLPIRRRTVEWTADSSGFYYIGGTTNSSSIWRQPLSGGEPQKIIEFPDRIFNFAWSKDEKNLAVSRGKQLGDAILITNLPFTENK